MLFKFLYFYIAFLVFLFLGLKVIDYLLNLGERIQLPKALLSLSIAFFLLYSFFAETAGVSGIIGAFVAGMLIGNTLKSRKIIDDIQSIAYGLFVPVFFVWIGAKLWADAPRTLASLVEILLFSSVIIVVAIISKIVGCGVGAKLSGMKNHESLQVGVSMVPRMELALIMASQVVLLPTISKDFSQLLFKSTVILAVFTTLLTPLLLKIVFTTKK